MYTEESLDLYKVAVNEYDRYDRGEQGLIDNEILIEELELKREQLIHQLDQSIFKSLNATRSVLTRSLVY